MSNKNRLSLGSFKDAHAGQTPDKGALGGGILMGRHVNAEAALNTLDEIGRAITFGRFDPVAAGAKTAFNVARVTPGGGLAPKPGVAYDENYVYDRVKNEGITL